MASGGLRGVDSGASARSNASGGVSTSARPHGACPDAAERATTSISSITCQVMILPALGTLLHTNACPLLVTPGALRPLSFPSQVSVFALMHPRSGVSCSPRAGYWQQHAGVQPASGMPCQRCAAGTSCWPLCWGARHSRRGSAHCTPWSGAQRSGGSGGSCRPPCERRLIMGRWAGQGEGRRLLGEGSSHGTELQQGFSRGGAPRGLGVL